MNEQTSADQFEAEITWIAAEPLLPGRSYTIAINGASVGATIAPLKYAVDPSGGRHVVSQLEFGETGVVELELDEPVPFATYEHDPARASFEVLDALTDAAVGRGRIHFALRRSANVLWQATDVDRGARAQLNGHGSCIVWLTGLSGAGKSTIANLLERRLHGLGVHTYLLDGDNVRHGLNKDLGFTAADRVENIRRVGEVAKLMMDAGLVVVASFISPYRNEREMVRGLVGEGEFVEVFVDAPLAVAEERDPKGLYAKARAGELVNFTGIDAPYEAPEHPELRIPTAEISAEEGCELILDALARTGIVREAAGIEKGPA